MRKKKMVIVALVLCLLLGGLFFCGISSSGQAPKTAYSQFRQQVLQNEIDRVILEEDQVLFRRKGEEQWYQTDHPQTPTFKEELLMAGILVEQKSQPEEVFYEILDWFTSFLLIGIVIVLAVKFLQPFEFKASKKTGKGFSDVIGLEQVKEQMLQVVELMKHPELLKNTGTRQPKGVILSGSPGNGKTLFAKALADESGLAFIATRATDFQSMFMAVGPAKIKKLFRYAKRKAPCIIFIDEFDGIGTRRSYSGSGIETENLRIVTALLNEMDGFSEKDRILVLAATNNPKALDPALIRPGRFDKRFSIGIPDEGQRRELIALYTKDKRLAPDFPKEELVGWTKGMSCAAIESFLNEAALLAERIQKKAIDREILLMLQRGENTGSLQD